MPRRRPNQSLADAKNYALRLLKIRLRSEKEITDRLKQRRFAENATAQAVAILKAAGLINDREFTRNWIQWRLSKPLGQRRIRLELLQKGVASQLIDQELVAVCESRAEDEIVRDLAYQRAQKYHGISQDKIRHRVYGYLIRRGFDPSIVRKTVQIL